MTLDSSIVLRAAEWAAGTQQYPKGALYVVATPIGNLADLSLRAVQVLALCDRVACEDTRVTSRLLSHLGLSKPLMAAHEHNEARAAAQVVAALQRGERVVFASDAGTPGVSDPGARLVDAVRRAGLRVVPIPGPTAVATALSVAGVAASGPEGDGYVFAGFLPAKGESRRAALSALCRQPRPFVLFESPHRIGPLARELADQAAERAVTCCRELTKQFESIDTVVAAAFPAWLEQDANRSRGEFVLVVHAAPLSQADDARDLSRRLLAALVTDVPVRRAVEITTAVCGGSRNELYQLALQLRDSDTEASNPD